MARAPRIVKAKDKKFLNELFYHHGLSVTALNNYLKCPWLYFYNNLIRAPRAQNKFALYGTSVHAALKDFFNEWQKGAKSGKQNLLSLFELHAEAQAFSARDLEATLLLGKKSLAGYYDAYHQAWKRPILNEFEVRGVDLGRGLKLTGKIDKLEILREGGGQREVNVVDYKTRKPLSRNELLGKTKNASGDYLRQLVFYKLLLERYKPDRFMVPSGDIDFIEPDPKGRYKKESFVLEESQVKELEELIRKVAKEIIGLEFWKRFCSDPKCEYCQLRKIMRA